MHSNGIPYDVVAVFTYLENTFQDGIVFFNIAKFNGESLILAIKHK